MLDTAFTLNATVGLNLNIFSSQVIRRKLQSGYPARLFILKMYSLTLDHLCSHYPNSKKKFQMHRYLSQLSPRMLKRRPQAFVVSNTSVKQPSGLSSHECIVITGVDPGVVNGSGLGTPHFGSFFSLFFEVNWICFG